MPVISSQRPLSSRESSEVRRTVTLSKGSDDGIVKGDVVIAAGGALVGRVTDVGPNFAMVTLINDRTSTVIGETETNGAKGDVVGQLGGALIMQNIDSTETVTPGEQVLTAGIELPGGIRSPYPKGLIIGEVTDVKKEASSVVQTAYLLPTTDLDKLSDVLVVLDYVARRRRHPDRLQPDRPRRRAAGRRAALHRAERRARAGGDPSATVTA